MDYILSWLYDTSHQDRRRTKPMEVLALGLSRSGTESLRQALLQLGYDHTYHGYDVAADPGALQYWTELALRKWAGQQNGEANLTAADFDRVIGHCVATTDMTGAAFAPEFIAAYPEAKVVLNTRKDVEAWFQSSAATFGVMNGAWGTWVKSYFEAELYWRRRVFETLFYKYYFGSFEATAKWRYREHSALIKGLVPPERLLEWSVEDGWEPLCAFLGKEVPKTEFPQGNAPAQFLEKVAGLHKEQSRIATRNMVLTGGVVIGLVAALVKVLMRKR